MHKYKKSVPSAWKSQTLEFAKQIHQYHTDTEDGLFLGLH